MTTRRPGVLLLPLSIALWLFAIPASGRMLVDDTGRQVDVPENPIRIVSLDDADLTVPLLELGVIPIASQGRIGKDGRHFVRSSLNLTGLDFDNTGMAFLGMQPVDVEMVAALKPDLILTLKGRPTPPEQLQAIAPTVVIDDTKRDSTAFYALLSELTNSRAEFDRLERRYRAQIAQLRRIVGTGAAGTPKVSVISATVDGKISVERSYGSLGAVLRDAGFAFPSLADEIADNSSVSFSPEALLQFDADIIFDTYRNDKDEQPADAKARMTAILPNYCHFLQACRQGRYYLVPRDEAKSFTYAAKAMAVALITGIASARDANGKQ